MKKYHIIEKYTGNPEDTIGQKTGWKVLCFNKKKDVPQKCYKQYETHCFMGYVKARNENEAVRKYCKIMKLREVKS